MTRQHCISNRRFRALALSVSAAALLVSTPSTGADEKKERPKTTILVYNTWINRADFFEGGVRSNGFSSAVKQLLLDVNPDTIVYPELTNENLGLNPASSFVNATARVLDDTDADIAYRRIGESLIVTRYSSDDLGSRRARVKPTDGFPEHIVNGVHLNYYDDPKSGRLAQAKELNRFVADQLLPVISAGDYNAGDVSERGLHSRDQILWMLARHISGRLTDGYHQSVLNQYIQNASPEGQQLIQDVVAKWRKISNGLPEYRSLFPDWDRMSWDEVYLGLRDALKKDVAEAVVPGEDYPIPNNMPVTLNILKKENQLIQLERNRELFQPSRTGDGRSTWPSDGRMDTNNWPSWDRSVIDHILVSRPYAKWMLPNTDNVNTGILNGRTTSPDGKDPSDHESVALELLWYGPNLTVNADRKHVDLGFEDNGWLYNESKEFNLTRNNQRTDVRFDNITDENGSPIYRDDVNAVGKVSHKMLTDQVADLIAKGLLQPEEGIDYANDPNAALKMRISCRNRTVLETVAGARELCVDNHSRFMNLDIANGVVVFDEAEALGDAAGTITLINGGLRVAGKDDVWARWLDTPIYTVSKAIELADGVGSFNVTDAGHEVTLESHVSGSGSFEKRGAGDLIMAGNNSYSGATIVRGGTLRPSNSNAFGTSGTFIVHGGRLDLGGLDLTVKHIMGTGGSIALGASSLKLELDRDSLVSSSFEGTGEIRKTGTGSLVLDGASTHNGQLTVAAGELVVGSALSNQASTASRVTLESGTRISGNGTVGSLTAKAGSLLAPGNSIGTLSITVDLRTEKGSLYDVELAANGDGDRINVGGTAYLNGGHVTALTLDPETSYINGQRYRIVDAKGGVQGAFDGVSTESAFLDMVVRQEPSSVDLQIRVRRDVDFVDTAITENQKSVASAADRMLQDGNSLALYNKLLPLSAAQSRKAYDQLSGEVYAGLAASLIDDNRSVRDAAGKHLRNRIDTDEAAFWSSAFGLWGKSDATDNYESAKRQTKGLLLGGDVRHDNGWLFGAFGGYGTSDFDVKNRGSSASDSNYTVGAYAGYTAEAFGVQFGAANRWHNIDVSRTVAFKDFFEGVRSDFNANSFLVFGEVNGKASLGAASFEPYLTAAHVAFRSGSYQESGMSGLYGGSYSRGVTYTTLGSRMAYELSFGETVAMLRGDIGWQYAFGDTNAASRHSLSMASNESFGVKGTPIAKSAALVELGLDWSIGIGKQLSLSYQGQYAAKQQQHGVKAKLEVRF